MYSIRVTNIEKFRRFIVGASSFDTEQDLISILKGTFLGNEKTDTGTGFHKIVEGEAEILGTGVIGNGIFFTREMAEPAISFRNAHRHMICEVAASRIYKTKYGDIRVTGTVDGLEGREIRDTKLRFSPPDFQEYSDSYQWRYYLSLMGVDRFFYDIYEVCGYRGLEGHPLRHLMCDEIRAYDPLPCLRYDGMEHDLVAMLNDLLDYIEFRNLWQFLKTAPNTVTA